MAEGSDQPGGAAAFVREIVSDPNNVPDVMLVYGYLGASGEADHERLYLGTDLANYVEIPGSAILHRLAAPPEQDPHGGVTLWVRKDAKLVYKMAPGAQALAHYFAGQIQAGAAAAGAPQPTPPAPAPGFGAGPQGPVAGVSVLIRSCIWCVPSVHFDCTLAAAGAPQGPVAGVSVLIRSCIWCVPSVHFDCTLAAVDARQGPVALGNSQFIRSCIHCGPSFFWNCTLAAANVPQGPVAAIGNSQFIRSCVDTNCIRTHLICTM